MTLTELSDDDLLARLHDICVDARRLDVRLIVYLIEVEERRLHLKVACSSLFEFCIERLHMTEGAAFRRINAARLTRRFPSLLGHLESGRVHLSTLVLLRDHLTESSVDQLVAAAAGKNKRGIEELLAHRAARPDVPSKIRKLPAPTAPTAGAAAPGLLLDLSPSSSATPPPRARIEPLSESRYKVQLTVSAELRDKLERAKDLMRHRNPSGNLAIVVERALDALVEKLEKERLAKTSRPRRTPHANASKKGRVPAAVRRDVFARDGEQCTFVDEQGRRCSSRAFLELDHIESRALGGPDDAANLRVACRAHNGLHAEEVFGRKCVDRGIRMRQRKCETSRAAPAAPAARDALDPLGAATRGLVRLGFREHDARRAITVVSGRHADAPPIQDVLREAIAVLTAGYDTTPR